MKNLSAFFGRYKRLTPPDMVIRDSVVVLLEEHLSYTISRGDVEVRGRVVFVNCPALVKNEIFLRKEEFILKLSESISPHQIDDIR